ncbi:conserved hypothetical protein [Anaeromyxobacter sp. K]|uniref:Lnb N-terminal periplasmic domain-containing protein n=1 Tax=Anaeromyxobacter sp. (strain K) TaxID=447217 RepID=UPI00015F9ACC|nr:DUF4105 domain-containing protein [Anaeromyxobacter sp. K]ACG71293.1 conserved hypothetical protein [Anaeromyxobacter sp. K]
MLGPLALALALASPPAAPASPSADPGTAPAAAIAPAAAPAAGATAAPDPAYLAELVAKARALRLAEDPGWLKLGHWRRRPLGGWKSEADGGKFFRARDGKTDPAAELEATLAGFFDATPKAEELDDAQCRFPARFAFLGGRLGFDLARLPPRRCPKFEDFYGKIRPQGVTVVFSSYYLNNPASAFGHTLLRLDKAPEAIGGKHFELLDYGVDYAATVDTGNALLYAAKGLLGFFKGEFKYYPYYYKVREYGDYESRDLWEYDLELTPGEVALLGAHVWELGGTWFDYWYLDENCSYHVLGALEAAAPRLDLLSHVGRAVVLPSDTVVALFENPGLVRRVHYRPSIRTQFEARARGLSGAELREVEALSGDPAAPLAPGTPPDGQAKVLDAAVDLLDLRHARELIRGFEPKAAQDRQALLERRAALGVPSAPLALPLPEARRPERGHGSLRLGVGGGAVDGQGGTVLLDARLALHDLGDPPEGYPPTAQIEFLPTRLRWTPRERRVDLDDVALVRIVSLSPVTRFDARPSWKASFGATTVRDRGCDRCLAFASDLGGGLAAALPGGLDLAATGDLELRASPGLSGAGGTGWRPGIGPSALARLRLGTRAVLLADARWRWLPEAAPRTTWSWGGALRLHLARDLSLALEGRRQPLATEAAALVLGYF